MIALDTMPLYNGNAFCIVGKRIKSDQGGLIDPTAPLPRVCGISRAPVYIYQFPQINWFFLETWGFFSKPTPTPSI